MFFFAVGRVQHCSNEGQPYKVNHIDRGMCYTCKCTVSVSPNSISPNVANQILRDKDPGPKGGRQKKSLWRARRLLRHTFSIGIPRIFRSTSSGVILYHNANYTGVINFVDGRYYWCCPPAAGCHNCNWFYGLRTA